MSKTERVDLDAPDGEHLTPRQVAQFILDHAEDDTKLIVRATGIVKKTCNDHYPPGAREQMGLAEEDLLVGLKAPFVRSMNFWSKGSTSVGTIPENPPGHKNLRETSELHIHVWKNLTGW